MSMRSNRAVEMHLTSLQGNVKISKKFMKLPEGFKQLRSIGPLESFK